MSAGRLRGDARADSSTIGVVLMIGVAAILSAVAFGSFAGLGSENLTETPKVTIAVGFDQGSTGGFGQPDDGDDEAVTVTHESGDELNWLYFAVYVDGTDVRDSADLTYDGSAPTELTAGDSVRVVNDGSGPNDDVLVPGTEIRVTYENPNTDQSFVLAEAEIP
jgi:FlaG/FlaF family flagellin (archaellin)